MTTAGATMTDHPTDTDIIAAHQSHVFLFAVRTGPDDDGPFWSARCMARMAHHETCSWPGVDTLTRDEAVRAHADHVAEALTAARTIATVDELDALPAGTVVLDRLGGIVGRERNRWSVINAPFYPTPEDIVPATILHRPDSEDPS